MSNKAVCPGGVERVAAVLNIELPEDSSIEGCLAAALDHPGQVMCQQVGYCYVRLAVHLSGPPTEEDSSRRPPTDGSLE